MKHMFTYLYTLEVWSKVTTKHDFSSKVLFLL